MEILFFLLLGFMFGFRKVLGGCLGVLMVMFLVGYAGSYLFLMMLIGG